MVNKTRWYVSANPEMMSKRSKLNKIIRDYFNEHSSIEIETPILGAYASSNPFTHSLQVIGANIKGYLQTSPESYLKQYIVHYPKAKDVFSIAKVFRDDYSSQIHQPEFSMLEWYRKNTNNYQLADEVIKIIQLVYQSEQSNSALSVIKISYQQCIDKYINIQFKNSKKLSYYQKYNTLDLPEVVGIIEDDEAMWLQLLWTSVVEPQLNKLAKIVVVFDYPVELAVFASIQNSSNHDKETKFTSTRFEVFVFGIEIANGWEENNNSTQIDTLVKNDHEERIKRDLVTVDSDEALIYAQKKLPKISGVSIGLDRLYSLTFKTKSISDVISFTIN